MSLQATPTRAVFCPAPSHSEPRGGLLWNRWVCPKYGGCSNIRSPRPRKGEVFAYAGSIQTLKDLKDHAPRRLVLGS